MATACSAATKVGGCWPAEGFGPVRESRDLVPWTRWEGPPRVEPSEPWDDTFAHEPWLLKQAGVVYHCYCAVGREGCVIALATSRDLREKPPP
jgi:hypothetical protein